MISMKLMLAVILVIVRLGADSRPGERIVQMEKSTTNLGIVRKTPDELARSAIGRVTASYPLLPKAARIRDVVAVDIVVDEQGNVISTRPYRGHSLLRDAAIEAARQWKFTPAKTAGRTVRMTGTLRFDFNQHDFLTRDEELTFFLREVEMSPGSAPSHYNLGRAYHRYDNYQKAIEEYKQALKLDSQFSIAYYAIAYDSSLLRRYDEAIQAAKQAIRLTPNFVEAYYELVGAYVRAQRPTEAIEVCKELTKIRPDLDILEHVYINISSIHKGMGRTEETIEAYKELIKVENELQTIEPDFARAGENFSNMVARMYEQLGRNEEAIESYKQTIRIAPYSDEAFAAYLGMASIHDRTGRREEARKVYNEMLDITRRALRESRGSDTKSSAYGALGLICERLGRDSEALQAYKNAVKLRPDWVVPHVGLGRLYLKAGDRESAYKEYLIVKRLDEEAARELAEILDILKKTEKK
jgi:TonB family protein